MFTTPRSSFRIYQTLRHPSRVDLWCAHRPGDHAPDFIADTWLQGPVIDATALHIDGFDQYAATFACAIQGYYIFNTDSLMHLLDEHLVEVAKAA